MKRTIAFAYSLLSFFLISQSLFAQNTNPWPATGNVGIGIAVAGYPLHVVTSTANPAFFKANTTSNASIAFANSTAQVNIGVGSATPHPYIWSSSGSFSIGNDGSPAFFVKGMGNTSNVGINTTNPTFNLDVNGSLHTSSIFVANAVNNGIAVWVSGQSGSDANLVIQGNNQQAYWLTGTNGMLRIGGNGGTEPSTGVLNIDMNGNSAFGGNTSANYKLNVWGSLRANQVTVNTTGADFVFEPSYRLPSLREVENYIRANHHLPDVAPAKQMQAEGVNLGDNQTLLLQKVEELTLYIIQQDKKIGEQDKKMAEMQAQIEALKKHR